MTHELLNRAYLKAIQVRQGARRQLAEDALLVIGCGHPIEARMHETARQLRRSDRQAQLFYKAGTRALDKAIGL